jgi:hypothetical protein
VIYSMTTSTHADAPRGMNFLYSLNRLNVATSRAKCLSILVCSPALFEPECRTRQQIPTYADPLHGLLVCVARNFSGHRHHAGIECGECPFVLRVRGETT